MNMKIIVSLLCLLSLSIPRIYAEEENKEEQIKKALITLTLTCGICAALKQVGENKTAIKDFPFTYGELEFIIGLSGICWTLKNLGIHWCGDIAKKLPIAAACLKLANSETFQASLERIPVFGSEIWCSVGRRRDDGRLGTESLTRSHSNPALEEELDPKSGLKKINESQFALRRGLQAIFLYSMAERVLPLAYSRVALSIKSFFRKKPLLQQS